ncbi:MAG: hypothetical protein ACREMQ_05355 [Longimicrobiales bacterium]
MEVANAPPPDWSPERRSRYLDWSEEVIAGCRGVSPSLEAHYDRVLEECRVKLRRDGESTRR